MLTPRGNIHQSKLPQPGEIGLIVDSYGLVSVVLNDGDATFKAAQVFLGSRLGAARVSAGDLGHEEPTRHDLTKLVDGDLEVDSPDEPDRVGIQHRVLRCDHVARTESRSFNDVQELIPVDAVEDVGLPDLEAVELDLSRCRFDDASPRIASAKGVVGVGELRPSQPDGHGNPQDLARLHI